MEKENKVKKLEAMYEHSIVNKKKLEDKIIDQERQINNLISSLETDLSLLKDEQYRIHCLKEEISEARKNYVKDLMNLSILKKPLSQQLPIISKVKDVLKEKKKELKGYLDGTSENNKWLDERYEEYKTLLQKNNEQIKTKEDFAKIALTLKEANDDSPSFSVKNIVNKISDDYGYARKSINNVLKILHLDKNKPLEDIEENNINKKEKIFSHWVEYNNLDRYNIIYNDINDLYNEYLLFVRHMYSIENVNNLTYTKNNFEIEIKKNLH